jgi:hypothetical protein
LLAYPITASLTVEKQDGLQPPYNALLSNFFPFFNFLQRWEGEKYLNLQSMGPVALSCIFGLAISFFGFSCRQALSATSFTVVGVTNKLLTVLINVTVWTKHAGAFGICMLLVCISGGVLYQVSHGIPAVLFEISLVLCCFLWPLSV